MNQLISVADAALLIRSGAALAVAGPEAALDKLPPGRWIGGTIPYFMLSDGGTVVTDERVFVTDLTNFGEVHVARYGADELSSISEQAPDNGFALTIIPGGSAAHKRFAAEAAGYPAAFLRPTAGWIAGVHLSDLGRVTPKVYDGRSATKHDDGAVVAHVALPSDKLVSIEIVNLFEPDDGDVLTFDETASFQVRQCRVNGKPASLAAYVQSRGLAHGRLPLVGDFAGAHVNVSLQNVDVARDVVDLYAPVFPGVEYRFARPVDDYAAAFRGRLSAADPTGVVMGCNCVLNFVYGELQGRTIGGIAGPATFGEIAYQLLNQTMVLIRIA
jgi:hypothetical protein